MRGEGLRILRYPAGDVLVISGLPGSGKSTLMQRAVDGADRSIRLIDSQDARQRWETIMPSPLPYAAYRPLVRIVHYARLRRAMASGQSMVVHDCGSLPWVRQWLVREARRRGCGVHLLVLDVPESAAREGQRARGREVSAYAMARHRRATRRLAELARSGGLDGQCASAVLLDRLAAASVGRIIFD